MPQTTKYVLATVVMPALLLLFLLPALPARADGPPVRLTQWGTLGSENDQFIEPAGIDVDTAGNVYVADSGNFRVQKFDNEGNFLLMWGFNVNTGGPPEDAVFEICTAGTLPCYAGVSGTEVKQFKGLTGIAVDSAGNVYTTEYFADPGTSTYHARVQKFDSSGNYVTQWGSYGTGDGQFQGLVGVAVDSIGNVYTIEFSLSSTPFHARVQKFDSSGIYVDQWGSAGAGDGQFFQAAGIAVDSAGDVYVSDLGRVQKFDNSGTFVSQLGGLGSGAGEFALPAGLSIDSSDNVYVSDRDAHRIQKFDSSGNFLLMWGFDVNTGLTSVGAVYEGCTPATLPCYPGFPGSDDGQFTAPADVAVDSANNVFVLEETGNRVQKFGQPPLLLTKSVNDDTPAPGQRITFTLTVDNNTGSDATNAVISDTLPAGLEFAGPVSLEGTSGVTNDPPTIASGLTISAHGRITATFPVTVDSGLANGTIITNTASVTSSEIVTPQLGSAVVTVETIDLTLNKSVETPFFPNVADPNPGERITYTITVSNAGPINATNAAISDTMPAGINFIGPVNLEGTTIGSPGEPPTIASGLTITANAKITLTFPASVSTDLEDGTIIINTAALTSAEVTTPITDPELIVVFDTISPTFPITNPLTSSPLITPTLGVILDITQPLFEWYPTVDNSEILTYFLTLSSTLTSAFDGLSVQADNSAVTSTTFTTTQTSFTPTIPLPNGVYTWTVRAVDGGGNTNETPILPQTFSIQANSIFTVTDTGDLEDTNPGDGVCETSQGNNECTLRAALMEAKATTGLTPTVVFSLTGDVPVTITPGSALPVITRSVIIDGLTQPGASCTSWPPNLLVEIDGSSVPPLGGIGLQLGSSESSSASGSLVRGLVINNFSVAAILVNNSGNSTIECNFLGTTRDGLDPAPNQFGIALGNAGGNVISGNLISGNADDGVIIGVDPFIGGESDGNRIVGNYIGTDKNRAVGLGNTGDGILLVNARNTVISDNLISGNGDDGIDITDNLDLSAIPPIRSCGTSPCATGNLVEGNYIGTNLAGEFVAGLGNGDNGVQIEDAEQNVVRFNTIAGNGSSTGGHGVQIDDQGTNAACTKGSSPCAISNTISANSVFSNTGLGIDLTGGTENSFAVTENDADDSDTGSNQLQNYPVLTSALSTSGNLIINGSLASRPNTNYTLEFFASGSCSASTHGEGQTFLISNTVTTNGSGSAAFQVTTANPTGRQITGTSTDPDGNTSEFSACIDVVDAADLVELRLDKKANTDSAAPGETITYTLIFSSSGNTPASGVIITDYIPAEVSVQSVLSSGVALTETNSSPLVWQAADLSSGPIGIITISAVLTEPLAANLVFTNNASIDADNANGTLTKRVGARVKNVAPVLNPLDNQTITRTLTLTFTTRASDANGDELTYGLSSPPSGATINPSSGLFSWKPMETGTYTVTVVVTDTGGLTDSTNSRISVVEDGGQQIYLPVVIKSE